MHFYKNSLRKTIPTSIRRAFSTIQASLKPTECYSSMEEEEKSLSHLLQQCSETSSLNHGRAIHSKFIKESFLSSLFLHNHLLNMYAKCGDTVNALNLFDEMPQRNVVSWSAIISGLVQHGCPSEAISLFCLMHRSGVKPNEFTLVSALNACSLVEDSIQAYQIFNLIIRLGFESNVFLINAFLTSLIRQRKMVEAIKLFDKCVMKDIVSWNAMLAGYSQYSYTDIPEFWCKMNREGVRPDNFSFSSILTGLAALCNLKMGLQVHAQLVKYGHGDEICVGNSLVDMYLKNRNLHEASKVFHEMPRKDVVSWTQLASGCLQCGEPNEALGTIREMKKTGVKPNRFTLATALNACASLASLEEGRKAHSLRIKLGDDVDVCVDNALLDMYAKCGCMDGAWGVFRLMKNRSVIAWTTMIMGFAQNGFAREAIETFDKMRLEHVEPNYITFICVLCACGQGDFVDEGWEYFYSMTRDHGISPGEDHYACMVNLLGRAGQIKEAENLVLSMPFRPGVLVWQTLLGACRVHGEIETGKRAAQHALAVDKEDSSTYVLLSNMFADSSNWDDVGKLRELMGTTDVKKMPGCSWIELAGNV